MLRDLGLTYVIKYEVLLITTPKAAATLLQQTPAAVAPAPPAVAPASPAAPAVPKVAIVPGKTQVTTVDRIDQTPLPEELRAKVPAGCILAGRVWFGDGAPVGGKDVKLNFKRGADDPEMVHQEGWFYASSSISAGWKGTAVVRAFGYDPTDFEVTATAGKVTWCEIVMAKTPPEKRRQFIEGLVTDEKERPIRGAHVTLEFPGATRGPTPSRTTTTDGNGHYVFRHLGIMEFDVVASRAGTYVSKQITPLGNEPTRLDFKIYSDRIVSLDYVYQPDSSPRLSGSVRRGQISWPVPGGGLFFAAGALGFGRPDDLRLWMNEGQLQFRHFYVNGTVGHYDAGAVDFDSVTEADPKACRTTNTNCVVGHVYVVHTYDGHYAKFIVRDIVVQANGRSARKWADLSGKFSLEAEFVDLTDGKVRLKKEDGSIITVPIEKLSPADREYLDAHTR
jgi:hypothetical protein